MKIDMFVQFKGNEFNYNSMVDQFKEFWKNQGRRIKDIKTLNLYFNINDNKLYYVVNDSESGSIS